MNCLDCGKALTERADTCIIIMPNCACGNGPIGPLCRACHDTRNAAHEAQKENAAHFYG